MKKSSLLMLILMVFVLISASSVMQAMREKHNTKELPRFSAVADIQLHGTSEIFFKGESYVEKLLGAPQTVALEDEGYVRDPVGIFDLKRIIYPGLQLIFIREVFPQHLELEEDGFRFKEVQVHDAGIPGPRGVEVGTSLKDLLKLFPISYEDEENRRQYSHVYLENGSVSKIEFSDYVVDSPHNLFTHHFLFTVYFENNQVKSYSIKHVLYDL